MLPLHFLPPPLTVVTITATQENFMSLTRLYNSIMELAEKSVAAKDTRDVLNIAAATLQMANAYNAMKDIELHERFHIENEEHLPGDAPIHGGSTN